MAHALIFDSGVGGLSVSAEIRNRLPSLQQSYAADDVYRPYGEKDDADLQNRLPELLWSLCTAVDPDLAVIACNTASTSALKHIRAVLDIPVIGVVPAVKPAAGLSPGGRFAVLGTPGTIRREYVDKLIRDFAPDHEVVRLGSTALVQLAEDKLSGRQVSGSEIHREIQPLIDRKVDTIVLACTHFPLLKAEIENAIPYPVKLIDSGEAIARRVETLIQEMSDFKPRRAGPDLALLVGHDNDPVRRETFKAYGFERVIGLHD